MTEHPCGEDMSRFGTRVEDLNEEVPVESISLHIMDHTEMGSGPLETEKEQNLDQNGYCGPGTSSSQGVPWKIPLQLGHTTLQVENVLTPTKQPGNNFFRPSDRILIRDCLKDYISNIKHLRDISKAKLTSHVTQELLQQLRNGRNEEIKNCPDSSLIDKIVVLVRAPFKNEHTKKMRKYK